jgi:DNA-3-methyladenine glycosylase
VQIKGGPRDGLILIRAIEPRRGIALMKKRRGIDDLHRLCSGPGKLTQALDITNRHHELDLCADPRHGFAPRETPIIDVVADARIGISRSAHYPWRFTLRGSKFVSRAVRL